ncbi:MAG: hypothetical protein M1814_001877 [Vezdaea aestivalis]|nr:MAG: hypothetical protein M1814_001877 [Vezdaea aestivalis]
MWVFLRALSLHLQICWEVVPGKKFFYGAQLTGWGIPAIASAVALAITGVSYRFGDTCHINHRHALADFWGPMLGFAGCAIVVQFATFGYCLQVYLRAMMDDRPTTTNSSSLPSYSSSVRTIPSARQAYRRIRKVLSLQWRGIFVVILIVADVIFFSVVFVFMDNATQVAKNNPDSAKPWLLCLVINKGDKNKCLDLTKHLVLPERTVLAVLLLLSTNGLWLLVALGRWSMITGWVDLFRTRFRRKTNFVSIDARRESINPRTYEMLASPRSGVKSPDPLISAASPQAGYTPTLKESGGVDYFDRHTSRYNSPHLSFSSPKAPQRFGAGDSKLAGNGVDPKDFSAANKL